MKEKSYIIRLHELKLGVHQFELYIDQLFFENRDFEEFQETEVKVALEILKQNSLITLKFELEGWVGLHCDRCTIPYKNPIRSSEEMFVKYGEADENQPENVISLPHGEIDLDLSQHLFEFMLLAIPSKRVPCENDSKFQCDDKTLKELEKHNSKKIEIEPKTSIWDELKNIHNN